MPEGDVPPPVQSTEALKLNLFKKLHRKGNARHIHNFRPIVELPCGALDLSIACRFTETYCS